MDPRVADAILEKFSKAALQCYPDTGYAYIKGYFQSALLHVLEKLPPDQCMHELQLIDSHRHELERETVYTMLSAEDEE